MANRKTLPVRVGDRFVKSDDLNGRVWTVIRVWITTDGLPHARMENGGQQRESRIMSISALTDRHFYIPAPSSFADIDQSKIGMEP